MCTRHSIDCKHTGTIQRSFKSILVKTQLYVSVHYEPMAKGRKLKWNMRAVNAEISMRGNRVSLRSLMSMLGFLNRMGSLNQTKCFMMMMASFMDLHCIHNLCLQGQYFKLVYHHPRRFLLGFETRE